MELNEKHRGSIMTRPCNVRAGASWFHETGAGSRSRHIPLPEERQKGLFVDATSYDCSGFCRALRLGRYDWAVNR
ncbi:putative protein [Pseudomonas sp. St290]|nr:putative protein [Pseudomonas sp. St290]